MKWLAAIFFPCLALSAAEQTFVVTAYCPCPICCGHRATGLAANGRPPVVGRTIAGPRRFPLVTRVHIVGLGDRIITDRSAKRYDARLDVFFPTHAEAKRFGRQTLTVTLR